MADKYFIFGVCVLVFLCGCVGELDVSKCSNLTVGIERDSCYVREAENRGDARLCGMVLNEITMRECFRNQSSLTYSICEMMQTNQSRDSCKLVFALRQEDPGLCEGIESRFIEDECYMYLAEKQNNTSLCNRTSTAYKRDLCRCQVIVKKGVAEECDSLEFDTTKQICFQETGQCGRLEDTNMRESCYLKVAYSEMDPGVCEELELNRKNCYSRLAVELCDYALCVEAKHPDNCVKEITIKLNDSEGCKRIEYAGARSECFELVDPSVCNVQGGFDCFFDLALEEQDPEFCLRIPDQYMTDLCLMSVARRLDDSNICLQIADPQLRERCVSGVG